MTDGSLDSLSSFAHTTKRGTKVIVMASPGQPPGLVRGSSDVPGERNSFRPSPQPDAERASDAPAPFPRRGRASWEHRRPAKWKVDTADARRELDVARGEQRRLSARHQAATGTSSETPADSRLRAAGDMVAAREAWLHWLER